MTLAVASRRRAIGYPLVAVAGVLVVGLLGGLATEIGPWYRQLQKPPWQPPDWLFGPVWTTIYVLVAIAGVRAARAAPDSAARRRIALAFVVNAVLNVLWSVLFFSVQRPDWALYEVGFLWASIALLMVVLARWSRSAGWLLVPYLAWVGFAAFLNWTIVRLNGPFG